MHGESENRAARSAGFSVAGDLTASYHSAKKSTATWDAELNKYKVCYNSYRYLKDFKDILMFFK